MEAFTEFSHKIFSLSVYIVHIVFCKKKKKKDNIIDSYYYYYYDRTNGSLYGINESSVLYSLV